MISRRWALCVIAISLTNVAATYRTANFIVTAPNEEIAKEVGQQAEKYRKEKAVAWLGKEMPQWGQPCPIKVTVTAGGPGGATSFAFDRGAILTQEMNVEGPLDRILASVLPHEITHTVFAYHFRQPLPRWADEGGAVLSEDEAERNRHDELVRKQLAGGKAFRLRVLFDMRQYPSNNSDVLTLYAQGYSLSRYLVESTSRPDFLNFVGEGMRRGWDHAVKTFFRMEKLEELEEAWLEWMRKGCKPNGVLVKNSKPAAADDSADSSPLRSRSTIELGRPMARPNRDEGNRPASELPPSNPRPGPSPNRRDYDSAPTADPRADPPRSGNGVILLPPVPVRSR